MKTRSVIVLCLCAAALAAFLPGGAKGQVRPPPASNAMLGILQHGNYRCALPGDAGGAAFIDVPSETFRIGTASSYVSPDGDGIYLVRGNVVVFTRGPKKDQRFKRLGENTLQKLNDDGTASKLICTRLGSAS